MFLNMFLTTAVILIVLSPFIIIQDRKGVNSNIIVTFSAPDGSTRAARVKIGFSWTIAIFKGWALLFRGQFIEWLIVFFGGGFLTTMATFSLLGFVVPESGSIDFAAITPLEWVGWALFTLADILLIGYYVIVGNKLRLRKLYDRGYSFEHPQNGDTAFIYEYMDRQPRGNQANTPLKPGVVQGQSHQYVVPDSNLEEPEETYDYSTLTIQDLKLLLKSEGIPFNATLTKEELLELVEENIAIAQRTEAKAKNAKYSDSMYHTMTVQELVAELDKRGIQYTSTMRKPDLVKLLVDNEK